ncbi:hypothetical protein AYJ57_21800 (plasmid) [Salipiger sp. CCB-MM3]|nr:hypothetical protein AYJ57_21800 [Salipiger sp. CCB-MM3]
MARGKYQLELQDMRAFLFLLYKSGEREDRTGLQRVPIQEILGYLGHASIERLEQSLRNLTKVTIDLDYINNGTPHSVSCHFLSFDVSRTIDGDLEYAFDPILMQFIFDPKIYAKINMAIYKEFKTTQGAKMFEILSLYQNRKHRTWHVSLEEFKQRFGVAEDRYNRFDNLRRVVIEKAIEECNTHAPFGVRVQYIRSGRGGRVTGLEFSIVPRSEIVLTKRSKPAKKKPRDPLTVDMLTGHSDTEAGRKLVVSEEAVADASTLLEQFYGTDTALVTYLDTWRASVDGEAIADPDQTFLSWLRARLESERSPQPDRFDNNVLDSILMEFE